MQLLIRNSGYGRKFTKEEWDQLVVLYKIEVNGRISDRIKAVLLYVGDIAIAKLQIYRYEF